MRRPLPASDCMNQHLMADGDDAECTGQVRSQRDHSSLAKHVQGFPSEVMIVRALTVVSHHVGVGGCHFVCRGPGVVLVREPLAQVEIDVYRGVEGVRDEIRRSRARVIGELRARSTSPSAVRRSTSRVSWPGTHKRPSTGSVKGLSCQRGAVLPALHQGVVVLPR